MLYAPIWWLLWGPFRLNLLATETTVQNSLQAFGDAPVSR